MLLLSLSCTHAAVNTPAEPIGARVARFPIAASLPRNNGGSASALPVSRPARRSLALRPACSLNRPRRPFFIGVLQPNSLPPCTAPTASGWSDSCRAGFSPAEIQRLPTAHGIIWVEGPSDRIYINRWIELYADGLLHEGRDYQCAHYGGALLSRIQFTPSEDANPDLANLFVVNPNVVVVCDGDRSRLGARLKDRVTRIFDEVSRTPRGHIWITKAREIENYLPGSVLAIALGRASLPDPEPHEQLFRRTTTRGKSYLERNLGKKAVDKVDLALLSTPHMTKETMKGRFDWESQMKEIVARVKAWND